MLDTTTFAAAALCPAGQGRRNDMLGRHVLLIGADETGGAVTIWEEEVEPGEGPPLHIHSREDETFYILEGRLRFWCGEESFEGGPGTTVVLPRGIPHRFENVGPSRARMLIHCTPGGFEGFFTDLAELPNPGPSEINAAAERYGLSFVG